jgi:hypothetical protein
MFLPVRTTYSPLNSEKGSCPLTPVVSKASAGALEYMLPFRTVSLDHLLVESKKKGYKSKTKMNVIKMRWNDRIRNCSPSTAAPDSKQLESAWHGLWEGRAAAVVLLPDGTDCLGSRYIFISVSASVSVFASVCVSL